MPGRWRTFTKSTANYMSLGNSGLGSLLSGLGAFSVHARIRFASLSVVANDNSILTALASGTTSGLSMCIDGSGPFFRIGARSVNTDTRQVKSGGTVLTAGVDYYVGGIVDIAGKTITVYLNGTSDGVNGACVFANATWTLGTPTDADVIGGFRAPPVGTPELFDGLISDLAVWNIALSGANFTSLGGGADPTTVANGNIIAAWALRGLGSPEPASTGPNGTITGSIPVYPPMGRGFGRATVRSLRAQ